MRLLRILLIVLLAALAAPSAALADNCAGHPATAIRLDCCNGTGADCDAAAIACKQICSAIVPSVPADPDTGRVDPLRYWSTTSGLIAISAPPDAPPPR